jgi:hypothetical protein
LDRVNDHTMPTIQQAGEIALALPEVTEGHRHGHRTWFVAGKAFAWERPFSKADIRRFGSEAPPTGPILAVRTLDLEDKEALLASELPGVFTIPHFDGYAAILIQLARTTPRQLRELVFDAWLARAPSDLADKHRPD